MNRPSLIGGTTACPSARAPAFHRATNELRSDRHAPADFLQGASGDEAGDLFGALIRRGQRPPAPTGTPLFSRAPFRADAFFRVPDPPRPFSRSMRIAVALNSAVPD